MRATPRPAPDFRNKLLRFCWGLVWLVLFRPSPRTFHVWRRFLLRCFGAKVGSGAKPYPGAKIWAPWNLVMGRDSTIGDGVDCYSVDKIVIGEGAVVSQRAYLCSATHDVNDPGFALATAPITLERKAWVAAEAFVGPGVTLAEGAVAGARAVVRRDVPAWTIVAGDPAAQVGSRSPH